MPSKSVSALIMVSCAFFGGLLGHQLMVTPRGTLLFMSGGILLGLVCIFLLRLWLRMEVERIVGGTVGVLIGSVLALVVAAGMSGKLETSEISLTIYCTLVVILALVGMQVGASKAKEMGRKIRDEPEDNAAVAGILDTSVIIDGRIADVCDTGFLKGDLIIPQFVLHELQMIADSSEGTKRTRGRRGLDILNKMKKQSYLKIIIDETDYPAIKEVDQKLIQMAKTTGHPIITNDFNLNKVAEVHSLKVLNVNQLATALKPIVLPGETMHVQVIKEGKESGQGLAYLDDGTMIVIENGRRHIGKSLDVTVTSVLQTTAGRMIFAAIRNN
jgi:uncharacterized protein YacL